MSKEKITTQVTETELRFLEYCRNIGYGRFETHIYEGQPKRIEKVTKNIRFDLSTEPLQRLGLTSSMDVE